MGSVLGYLVAGVVIGPFGFRLIGEDQTDVLHFAEFGVVLADNEYRHEIESDMEPFKGLLLGLFFISVGANIDFALILEQPWLIAGLVLVLVVVKFVVLYVLGKIFNLEASNNYTFAFALAQGGEFAFVLFSFATQNHVLPTEVANPLIGVVALSVAMTPLMLMFNDRLVQAHFQNAEEEREPDAIDENDNPVIIAGYGRFGQIVGRLLQANGFKITVLELDPGQIEMLRKFGNKVFYGNASRRDLLHAAGAEQARLFVLAIDDREAALETVDILKKHFPRVTILTRAEDRVHAYDLMKRNVDFLMRETFDSALQMGEEALRQLGVSSEKAKNAAAIFKRHDEDSMQATFKLWGDENAYMFEVHNRREALHRVLQSDSTEANPESDDSN